MTASEGVVALRRTAGTAPGTGSAPLTVGVVAPPTPSADEVVVTVEVVVLGAEDVVPSEVASSVADGDGRVTVGREAVGVIRTVGAAVTDWHPGDRVALPATLPCGSCGPCRAGRAAVCPTRRRPGTEVDGWAAAEIAVPAADLHHVPPDVASAEAALLAGTVATAYHACKRAGVGPGVGVAVVGVGPLAVHLAQVATLAGGAVVIHADTEATREAALDVGAELALDPADGPLADQLQGELGDGVDRVLLAGGDVDLAAAVAALRPGGRVVVVDRATTGARAVPLDRLVHDELDVVGSAGAEPQDVVELFDLAADGRLVLALTLGATLEADATPEAVVAAVAGDADRATRTVLRLAG